MNTVTRKTYELLNDNQHIIDTFLKKKEMIRILLGDAMADNLLSPGYFVCLINQCKKLVKLKNFNSMSSVKNHLRDHKLKNTDGTAKVLYNRFHFLTDNDWIEQNFSLSLEEKIANLEAQFYHESPLSLAEYEIFRAKCDATPKFKGSHLAMNEIRLTKMLNNDSSALNGLGEGIASFTVASTSTTTSSVL